MNAAAAAIVLEAAADGDVAAAGFRLAWHQLRWDERDGLPACERRRRFDRMVAETARLLRSGDSRPE